MNFIILAIIVYGMLALMIVFGFLSKRHDWAGNAFCVDLILLVVGIIFVLLFVFGSKRETRIERYDLDYFKALGNGYVYSYTDSDGVEHGDFVSSDEIDIGLSDETAPPFVEAKIEYGQERFWFLYLNQKPKTISETFYFMSAGSVEIP